MVINGKFGSGMIFTVDNELKDKLNFLLGFT